jgi:hypothetical protein
VGALAPSDRIAPWLPRRLSLGSSQAIALAAIVPALIVGFPSLLAAKGGDMSYAAAIVLMALGAVAGVFIGAEVDSGRTLVGRGTSRKSFRAVRDIAVQAFGSGGWEYGGETADSVWYSRSLGPNWALVAILFPFGVFPALLYFIFARRKQRAGVHWWSEEGATAVEITVSPKGYGGQRIAAEIARKLA